MLARAFMILLLYSLTACAYPQKVHAKPSAPVTIEHSEAQNVQNGVPFTATIRLTAETDLQQLLVTVSPYSDIKLLSEGGTTEFTNLKQGNYREVTVELQLTNTSMGYLSVFATTIDQLGNSKTKTIAIRYGVADRNSTQKLQSHNIEKNSRGDKLILMPGSPR